jgi:hypothetical protein
MGTISKVLLSGSNQGKPISITATGSTGTTIHTTLSSSTIMDEVWLYATNVDSTQRTLTIELGGTGTTNEIIVGISPRSGLSIILPGTTISGDGSGGTIIRGYSSSGGTINIIGYVNRITP